MNESRFRLPLGILILVCVGCAVPAGGVAQVSRTANTLTSTEGVPRPAATAEQLSFIVGHWRGPGLGGIAEEIWAPPMAGSLMGMFRMVRDDRIAFYEILTISPDGESLVLTLKHFHPDLRGWEAQDEVVTFPLLRLDGRNAYFDGMTFRREGGTLRVFVALGEGEGEVREAEFVYRLVRDAADGEAGTW